MRNNVLVYCRKLQYIFYCCIANGLELGGCQYGRKNNQNNIEIGETIAVEFKRCGNGIENDVYETVCSFLTSYCKNSPILYRW